MLGNKSIFIAISWKVSNTKHSFQTKGETYLRNNISVSFGGKSYKPIAESQLSSELTMLSDYIKPMFAQMLGDMGAGMSLFYFEITDNSGENALNPYNSTDFTAGLASVKNTFHPYQVFSQIPNAPMTGSYFLRIMNFVLTTVRN
ncbi:hypothetical protein [uncultured Fluviicola sp.]|uniref:hypothetical protein n=1 Tax=uncultured Fluviicola sp. TaxID=463303 RepID=UPI0025E79ED1|nr:hypothetical protein [uncultured Fluviicola sp.]